MSLGFRLLRITVDWAAGAGEFVCGCFRKPHEVGSQSFGVASQSPSAGFSSEGSILLSLGC